MRERRLAREIALQAMYAQEISGDSIKVVETNIIDNSEELPEELKSFARQIFQSTTLHKKELDQYIKAKSENWDFERIAVIDRLVIRCTSMIFHPRYPSPRPSKLRKGSQRTTAALL